MAKACWQQQQGTCVPLAALWMLPSSPQLPSAPRPSTAAVTQHWTPTQEEPAPTRPLTLTLLEAVEAPELHQAVPIVVVGDVDSVILGCRVLHPGPLIAPVAVVLHGGLHRLDGAFALHLLYWVPRERKRKAYPCPRQLTPPPSPWQIIAGLAWPRELGPQGRVPSPSRPRSPTSVWCFGAPGAISPLPEGRAGGAAGGAAGSRGGAGRSRGAGHGGLCLCDSLGWGALS